MTTQQAAGPLGYPETATDKGLKSGALGLLSSIVVGVASTAPAYSLAASLGSSSPRPTATGSSG